MARPRPEKKREPTRAATRAVLPMQLRVGDQIVDDSGEWQIVGRPYTVAAGKTVRASVQKIGEPARAVERTWGAHERVAVRREPGAERA